MKKLVIACSFIFIGLLIFKIGLKIGSNVQTIESTNEIHFIDPKLIQIPQPTYQKFLLRVLRDSLRNIKPPFTRDRLDEVVSSIEKKTNLKGYMTLLSVDDNKFKLIVGENRLDLWQSPFFLVNQDSVYYLKPLRIKYDLKK